jgi:predicted RNA-binding protein with PIN domain
MIENRKKYPVEHYIIDGYNVMHLIPKFRKLLNQDLENSRLVFIQTISDHFNNRNQDVTVVFDGERHSGEINALSMPKVKVIFSPAPDKADLKIKKLIDSSKNKALTIVVSSDREVFQYAKVSRCKALTSEKFNEIISAKPLNLENKIKNHTLSKVEIEFWKELFNKRKE